MMTHPRNRGSISLYASQVRIFFVLLPPVQVAPQKHAYLQIYFARRPQLRRHDRRDPAREPCSSSPNLRCRSLPSDLQVLQIQS